MYTMNKHEIFYDNADGQGIIINSLNGSYYALNHLSATVFELLCNGHEPQTIAEELLKIKDCPESLFADIAAFAEALYEEKILLSSATAPREKINLPEAGFFDNFKISFEKFDDMQDLLLSDPVHEASPETGWPNLPSEKEQ